MTCSEILGQLKQLENLKTKSVLLKHGAKEPFNGVRIEDLKKIARKNKGDHELSLELYKTGNTDAMFLAGLIADPKKMSKADLDEWAEGAYWYMLSENPVAWVTAESNYGMEMSLKWIESKKEFVADAGWATLSSIASIKPDKELDLKLYKTLLERVSKTMQSSPNRVRYSMNMFVIAVGGYIASLTEEALTIGAKIGRVNVNMGGVASKVPVVKDSIANMEKKGQIGLKKKHAKA
ncbi:MAG: DNA alkylation repair protein [Bacteroidetes bacterium]|nr:DNA alkylation repair protein [Bacteroidota bacterium]